MSRSNVPPTSSSPSDIAQAVRLTAAEAPARQAEVQGLRNAIAELTSRLQTRQASLADLERQQVRQQRLARLEEGKRRIRGKGKELQQAAQAVQSLLSDLEALNREYREDFNALYPNPAFTFLGVDGLVSFQPISLPKLVELEGKRFQVSGIAFDPSEAERLRAREEEGRRFAQLLHPSREQLQVVQERREREKAEQERERLKSLLEEKKNERRYFQDEHHKWSRAGGMNLDRITNRIGSLNQEIDQIESQLNVLTTGTTNNSDETN